MRMKRIDKIRLLLLKDVPWDLDLNRLTVKKRMKVIS